MELGMSLQMTLLKNNYYIQRHGESHANKMGIILSHHVDGQSMEYSLTEFGKKQVRESVKNAVRDYQIDNNTIIYSSDFSRARQTANITKKILKTNKLHITTKLRERFFGDYEKTSSSNYEKVWLNDIDDHNHKINNIESVAEVFKRVVKLIANLENKYTNRNILLVSHGDTLQILQTFFENIEPSRHRSLKHLKVAEIRKLN